MPYKSAKICYIGSREGLYALFDKQEVMRRRKPSILAEVKQTAAAIKPAERKGTSINKEHPEV
jgi:hypothetical protein